ncbi:hypothetical protein CHAB381_0993 [Campylobacter hominis ATCC BAA-381]|uniref:Uncharacterized protein n=1 Tax=Campylobacter hominis (strain ATCC BAA-381 / DSM 21671 / CCUG 45161 / LMG 19568 / NCTC 13146 / CH001A) TaxID=360107 RepID=A7I213_CAMHC|nr:hypothetical protein CHAB381_0993 [Campylobacter hominis ATCC BAA-381]
MDAKSNNSIIYTAKSAFILRFLLYKNLNKSHKIQFKSIKNSKHLKFIF